MSEVLMKMIFKFIENNPWIFLMIMSMLRRSYSIKLKIFPLIIVNKEYYKLLKFDDPQIKFLDIDWYLYPYYPVNNFKESWWLFDKNIENNEWNESISLSAYAVFKFLVHSNFIYSLEEIRVKVSSAQDTFKYDFNLLLDDFKIYSTRQINLKLSTVWYTLPWIQTHDLKGTIEYFSFNINTVNSYNKIIEILYNDESTDSVQNKDYGSIVYKWMSEDKTYTDEIHKMLNDILLKLNFQYNFHLRPFVDEWYHLATFDFYEENLYNLTFTVFIKKIKALLHVIKNNQKVSKSKDKYVLNESWYSSILGRTLDEGTSVDRYTLTNWDNFNCFSDKKMLEICIAENMLTIFCKNIDDLIINVLILGHLWPGLILKLVDFEWWTMEGISSLLSLIINGDETEKGLNFLFSEVHFSEIDLDLYRMNYTKYFEIFLKRISTLYTVKFMNVNLEDLINDNSVDINQVEENKIDNKDSMQYNQDSIQENTSNDFEKCDIWEEKELND